MLGDKRGGGGLIYLAGPIAAIGRPEACRLREELSGQLAPAGFTCFNPAGAWLVADAGHIAALQQGNDAVLQRCKAVVVLSTGHDSPGTAHEVRLAEQFGIPVAVYQANGNSAVPTQTAEECWWLDRLPTFRSVADLSSWLVLECC